MTHNILLPPKFIVGAGSIDSLGLEVSRLGKRALLVTGRSALRKTGITGRIVDNLAAAGIDVVLFDQVESEPSLETVDRARRVIVDERTDVVIGAGGGSAMDAAKVAAGLAAENASTLEFWNDRTPARAGIPFVAVPTTSGTGAEATKNGVITNPEIPAKKSIRDDSFVAKLVVLDAEVTLCLPPKETALSGMDALVQAIESYTSIHACALTDSWSIAAVELLSDSVMRAFRNGKDIDARTDAAYGSLLAGMSLANARLGHGLAHPLGARYHISHGLVCAVLLPHVMRFNRESCPEKYARLDSLMHGDADAHVAGMMKEMEIPSSLREFGVDSGDIPLIIEESLPSGSLKANPRSVTGTACKTILQNCLI